MRKEKFCQKQKSCLIKISWSRIQATGHLGFKTNSNILNQWFSTFYLPWPIFITQIIRGPLAYLFFHNVQQNQYKSITFIRNMVNAKHVTEICPPMLQFLEMSKIKRTVYDLLHRGGSELLFSCAAEWKIQTHINEWY